MALLAPLIETPTGRLAFATLDRPRLERRLAGVLQPPRYEASLIFEAFPGAVYGACDKVAIDSYLYCEQRVPPHRPNPVRAQAEVDPQARWLPKGSWRIFATAPERRPPYGIYGDNDPIGLASFASGDLVRFGVRPMIVINPIAGPDAAHRVWLRLVYVKYIGHASAAKPAASENVAPKAAASETVGPLTRQWNNWLANSGSRF